MIPRLNQKHILRRSRAILNCVKINLGLHSFCNTVSSIIGWYAYLEYASMVSLPFQSLWHSPYTHLWLF